MELGLARSAKKSLITGRLTSDTFDDKVPKSSNKHLRNFKQTLEFVERSFPVRARGARTMPRILIVDDHLMYRKALRGALESHVAKTHVVETDNLESACKRLDPDGCFDLSLIDLSTAGVSFETLHGLHECYPKTRFAAMMAVGTRADIMRSLDAGLYGFVSKSQSDSEILGAIKDMLSGRVYVPASLTIVGERTMNGSGAQIYHLSPRLDRAEALPDKLTPRQREVLALLARGMSNKEIARALRIAEGTTKIHASGVLRVLGVRNRTEAAAITKILSVTADSPFRRR